VRDDFKGKRHLFEGFSLDSQKIVDLKEIEKISESKMHQMSQILDARFATTFNKGSIPNSINIPFPEVLN
jgi:3-mercaptopyruvate sulfurtransferase SseA